MAYLIIDNRTISTPIEEIVDIIRKKLTNGKLQSFSVKGDDIRVTCPHHNGGMEQHPSCGIYIGNETDLYGKFHCFTCGEQGPFYHFVAECFDQSDEWAKNWLLENFADGLIERDIYLEPITLQKQRQEYLPETILADFEDYHPYMTQRKLTKEICEKFEIKYDPKTRCLVFVVRDETGKIALLTRRSVDSKKFIIDANKEKPVYLLYYMLQHHIPEVYVVESQINAATLLVHGWPAVALFGTGTKHQYNLLNRSGIRVFNLLFDGDVAGDKGIERFIKNIRKDVIVNVIRLPRGKDVNDLEYDELEKLIENNI